MKGSPVNLEDLRHLPTFALLNVLQIEFVELTLERVVATMPVQAIHHQPWGYLHGGVSVVLCETVAGAGALLHCPPGKAAFGIEINANHIRPKQSGVLRAVGLPLHNGRSTMVWEVKLYDEQEKLICASRCTLAVVALEQD